MRILTHRGYNKYPMGMINHIIVEQFETPSCNLVLKIVKESKFGAKNGKRSKFGIKRREG